MGTNKLLWIPRIITIFFIVFLSLFSFDVFSEDGALLKVIAGFLIHNIPSFLLIIVLVLSWKRPFISGIAIILFGILTVFFFKTYSNPASFITISLTSVITGGLYLLFYLTPKKAV